MGQRARIKAVRRKAVAVVAAQTTAAAKEEAVKVFYEHGVFNTKKAREVLATGGS